MQKRIGELLAERRQAMGASLADVEGATLIRAAYIDALEKGNYSLVPGQIYVKLYVKSYASFLGMDPQQAAEMLTRELEESGETNEENGAFSAAPDSRAGKKDRIMQKKRAAARRRTLNTALVLVALTTIVLLAYYLTGGKLGGGTDAEAVPLPAEASASESVSGDAAPEVAPEEVPIEAPAQAAVEETFAHNLSISFSDDCWIRAYADGRKVQEGIWRDGSSVEIAAEQGIWVRLGNAGGASLVYNGEDLGNPGQSRKVMDISFPSGYQPF